MAPSTTNTSVSTTPPSHGMASSDTDNSTPPDLPPPPYSKEPMVDNSTSISPTTQQRMPPALSSSSLSIHHMLNSDNLQHQQSLPLPPIAPESRDLSAAEALTQLTGGNTPTSDADTMVTTDHEDDLDLNESQRQQQQQRHPLVSTVSMVAKHPIVMNAVRYYETSKQRYSSFNYAAGIVEAAAIPVVTRIEDNLNTRHQTKRHASTSMSNGAGSPNSPTYTMSSFDNKQKKRRLSTSSTLSTATTSSYSGIVPSSDAKRRLQFCLHILKAANATISSKINFLQLKLDETELAIKEKRHQLQTQRSNESYFSDQTAEKTKVEIVGTVKKIIHLISNFRPSTLTASAGAAPAPASAPAPIASSTEVAAPGTPATPTTPVAYRLNALSRTSSFNGTPVPSGSTDNANTPTSTLTPTTSHGSCLQEFELKNTIRDIILRLPASIQHCENEEGNDRIFVFAKESLEMITKLTNVFSDQLAHVESWVNGEIPEDPKDGTEEEVNEKQRDVEMKDEKGFDSVSTRCSSEEPDGITSATKRMRIDELIEN
ncbi:OPI1 [Candida metapsilosis]|uniref:OPI1 n=1 Tax=Candida metapsilosis TaxID=273372 RepID=A0A8H8D908_9ASCO|nr:OPI1 [Candida metapsilosis]